MREGPRLLRCALGIRAAYVRARAGRGGPGRRGLHPRLLPARAGPLPRGHDHEAVARHPKESEASEAAAAVSRRQGQAVLQTRHRAAGAEIQPGARVLAADPRVGDLYLSAEEIAARVVELAGEIARDYPVSEPLLVAPLKASVVFL